MAGRTIGSIAAGIGREAHTVQSGGSAAGCRRIHRLSARIAADMTDLRRFPPGDGRRDDYLAATASERATAAKVTMTPPTMPSSGRPALRDCNIASATSSPPIAPPMWAAIEMFGVK